MQRINLDLKGGDTQGEDPLEDLNSINSSKTPRIPLQSKPTIMQKIKSKGSRAIKKFTLLFEKEAEETTKAAKPASEIQKENAMNSYYNVMKKKPPTSILRHSSVNNGFYQQSAFGSQDTQHEVKRSEESKKLEPMLVSARKKASLRNMEK